VISRVADHCFWLGRYVERADATARLLFVTRNYLALDAGLSARQCWLPVVTVFGGEGELLERLGPGAADDAEAIERYMTWDDANLASIVRSVAAARENARSIREVLSSEIWETVNELHLWIGSGPAKAAYLLDRHSFYQRVRQTCELLEGYFQSTMLHDAPLHFISLGVLLERVSQTARVVDVHHQALSLIVRTHHVVETALWLAMLRACTGFEPFMKRHQGKVTGDAVAEFLVFEPLFPKSVAYGVSRAHRRFATIRPVEERDLPGGETLARLEALDRWLAGRAGRPQGATLIHGVVTHVVDEITAICDTLGREMLGYGPPLAAESTQ
jgi:uncharacterized alpha-E superfamily protein